MSKIETVVTKPNLVIKENELEMILLTNEAEAELDNKIKEIQDYLTNTKGDGKTEEQKDNDYKVAQIKWGEYATILRKTKYNFFLNREQYKFLTSLLLSKLEYDVNTVFFAIDLTSLLGGMKEIHYKDAIETKSIAVDATEITYIYHLISTHKVKGLKQDAYTFAQILRKIGDISKIFNYYDNQSKELSISINDWVALLDPNVVEEKEPKLELIKS